MADGSVTIGVALDTASFSQSIVSLEQQIQSLGARINQSFSGSLTGDSMSGTLNQVIADITSSAASLTSALTEVLRGAASSAIAAFTGAGWQSAGAVSVNLLASGISSGAGSVATAASGVSAQANGAFSGGNWFSIGASLMAGVASGIRSAGAEVVEAIRSVSADANAAVKQYYQISSPSKRMHDEVGVMIARGIAEGITDGSPYIGSALSSLAVTPGNPAYAGSSGQGSRSVTQNIYLRDSDASPYRTAQKIRRESEAIFRA